MNQSETQSRSNKTLVAKLLVLAVAMFGFGFLLVPLYDIFCDILGIDSRPANTAAIVSSDAVDETRFVTVEFMAALNEYAPWDFRPNVVSMEIHPGKLYDTSYFALNLTDRQIVGQAVPSVAPSQAARYFHKTECFCFTSQNFGPNEGKDMGLQFTIDRELPAHIDRVTLSYTFFVKQQVVADSTAAES